MSPEQAQSSALDHRTDLWSVGAVLYEMLSGRRPYPRGVPEPRAGERSALPALLVAQRSDVPPILEQIVMKALERAPEERFASADAFAQALTGHRLSAP
jgi:serine/threonine-protein kinase